LILAPFALLCLYLCLSLASCGAGQAFGGYCILLIINVDYQ